MGALDSLKQSLRERTEGGIALAFSGGVDSSLLLAVLKKLHDESPFSLLALTMHSVFQSPEELNEVQRQTDEYGIGLKLFRIDPLSIPEIVNNPTDRCYWCKRRIFSDFTNFARLEGIATVIDGTNADDLQTYRPGRKALRELGIFSPLAELGITKSEVRKMAEELHLNCASKPSAPCLATRFEYGTRLTPEAVRQVVGGENLIRKILPQIGNVRLRVHGEIARIEVSVDNLAQLISHRGEIADGLKKLGFRYITLDLEGFRSGSMDQGLPQQ